MNERVIVNILVVGDPKKEGSPLLQVASLPTFETHVLKATNMKNAIKWILEKPIDIVLLEYELEDGDAVGFLEALNQLAVRTIPTVVLANECHEKMGLNVFRKGARDFIIKDKSGHYLQRLPLILEKILKEENRYRENSRVRKNSETILSSISDGMIGLNLDGVITFANPVSAMYLQKPFESLMNKKIDDVAEHLGKNFPEDLHKGVLQVQTSNQTVAIGQVSLTLEEEHTECLIKIYVTPVFNEFLHVDGYVLLFRDITETRGKPSPTNVQDELTGLPNRKSFFERLTHTLSYCRRYKTKCAVLFIDLDGFKSINDVLGHVGGDELLLKVVSRVKSVIRDADVIARVGGDEFMVLINYLGQNNDAGKMAAKINRALLPAFEFNGNQYYLTASIGVALYPNDSEDAQKLMQYADFAMRLAKKRGKNHYQYYQSDLNVEAERVMRISNDLRVAIASNQLELYFHPQICSVSGKLTGLEALLRWKHPELGMIPPALFIPIAEELGFIVNIGQWVLNRACECCIIWKAQGLVGFTISVNLSIKELQREEFVDDIAECVYGYQIEPSMLQFEITESIFAYDTEMIIHKLHQLKKIGFQIAMDDFGTGYSCLSYLKDLPIDVIKIDRSFVQALSFAHNERHKAIIASIIDLAQRLHITTLAEGVETEEQADYLRSLGCEHLQGFLIAKPMPFDKTTEFLSEKLQKTHWLPAAQKGGKDQN